MYAVDFNDFPHFVSSRDLIMLLLRSACIQRKAGHTNRV